MRWHLRITKNEHEELEWMLELLAHDDELVVHGTYEDLTHLQVVLDAHGHVPLPA